MKTIGEIISRADSIRANPFTAEQKAEWVSNLDARIYADYFAKKYPTAEFYRKVGTAEGETEYESPFQLFNIYSVGMSFIRGKTDMSALTISVIASEEPSWKPGPGDILKIRGIEFDESGDPIDERVLEEINKDWTVHEAGTWIYRRENDRDIYTVSLMAEGSVSVWMATFTDEYNLGMLIEVTPVVQPYSIPTSAADEILVEAPWDEMYVVYLLAQIDFYQGEITRHNAMLAKFQDLLENYTAYLARSGMFEAADVKKVPKIIY